MLKLHNELKKKKQYFFYTPGGHRACFSIFLTSKKVKHA